MAMELPRRLLDRLGRQLERLGQRLRRRVAPVPTPGPEPLPPEDAHAVWRAQVAHLSPEAWSVVAAPVLADGCAPIPLAPGSNRVSAWPSRAPLPLPALPTWQTVPSAVPSVPSRERPAPQAQIDVAQQPSPAFPLHPTTEEGVRWPAPLPLPPVSEPAAARPVMDDPVVPTPAAPDWRPAGAGSDVGHALPLPVIAHAKAVSRPLAWPEPDPVPVPASRGTETFTPAPARPTPAPAPWPRLAPADAPHAPQWWPRDVSQTPAHTWPPAAAGHRWPSLPPRIEVQADAAPDLPGRLIAHRHARLTAEQRG
ncbi:hypothetical protein [Sphaerotilus sp.]|uniref:hypothetical protein n=1 Tax=Sphaerotilus sp. TaxID=2093942 RepID=UPI0025DF3A42|nr:hypothetical protein [Sphaerotilus sp.]